MKVCSETGVNGAKVTRVDVPGGQVPHYEFFGATPALRESPPVLAKPPASAPHSPVARSEPSRLPSWVFAFAIGQGSLVASSSLLAYFSLRAVAAGGAPTDRYQQSYVDAVISHLSVLVGFVAILSLSIVISAVGASRDRLRAEVLGWCEGVLLLFVLVTAFAPPSVPGALWITSALGRPYGFSLTGVIAITGAFVVLGSMVHRYLVDVEGG